MPVIGSRNLTNRVSRTQFQRAGELALFVLLAAGLVCAATMRKRAPARTARVPAQRVSVVSKTVQAKATAKPVLVVPKADQILPGVVAGGPWTEPTYAHSTPGDT